MSQRLVMVMGVQRSGTNALFNSFAADSVYRAFNESDDSEIYFDWNLRPEPVIRGILREPGPVLLKPVNETDFREVVDVAREYRDYDVWIPWIYRDPVNVHFSWWTKWHLPPLTEFVEMWNRRNRSILALPDGLRSKVGIMRYEDLTTDRQVFEQACEFFDIKGDYQFRDDSRSGRQALQADVIDVIERGTAEVLGQLNASRTFRSARA